VAVDPVLAVEGGADQRGGIEGGERGGLRHGRGF
jgi:hypothetical protein